MATARPSPFFRARSASHCAFALLVPSPRYLARVEKQAELDVLSMEKLRNGEKFSAGRPDITYRKITGTGLFAEQYDPAKHGQAALADKH